MSVEQPDDGLRVPVARVEDLPTDRGIARCIAGREVAVFLLDGEPVAYDGRCRHRGGPLAEGYVRDGVVTCPFHWWRYDLRTGELVGNRRVRLRRYPAVVRDGEIVVTLEAETAAETGVGNPMTNPACEPTVATSLRERLLARARETAARR